MDLLYPRRTVWMFVIKDVLMTLSGKNPSLYRHDLFGLHTKQSDRLTISMNAVHKIPAKLMPKKFAMTSKVCFDSCANRDWNRYTCRTFLESLYWITKTFSPFASNAKKGAFYHSVQNCQKSNLLDSFFAALSSSDACCVVNTDRAMSTKSCMAWYLIFMFYFDDY